MHEHPHSHEIPPMEELTALMKYMIGHNAAHVKELSELAEQLAHNGHADAYEQVKSAVADFEKGNKKLEDALNGLNAE